jgi:hypothetical protein
MGHVRRMGEMINVYKTLVGNSEEKRPLGIPRCRWKYNINPDLMEIAL